LVWIDLEMTGLDKDLDHIIEIATIVTDDKLQIIAEGPVIAIHQSQAVMLKMDAWNQHHHGKSGLIERVAESTCNEAEAERLTLEFLAQHVAAGISPMCGNSICQDRRFLHRHMLGLEDFFHYRNLDVSSLKILASLWAPKIAKQHSKISTHQALEDIRDSIDELKFYRENFLICEDD
jgi:oligoribonuclease